MALKYEGKNRKKNLDYAQEQKNILAKMEDMEEKSEDMEEKSEESIKQPKTTTIEYKKNDMDKYLNNKESIDLLNFYGLKRPSEYKDSSLEEFEEAFEKGLEETAKLKSSIKNVAEDKKDIITGLILAYPIKGQKAKKKLKNLSKNIISCKFLLIIWGISEIIKH